MRTYSLSRIIRFDRFGAGGLGHPTVTLIAKGMLRLARNLAVPFGFAFFSGCNSAGVVLTPPPAPSPVTRSPVTPTPTTPIPATPTPVGPYVFTGLAAPTYGLIEYGSRGTAPIATMSGVPVTSIAVDGSGDIYVAGFTSVSELAPRTHRVIRTLTGFSQINDIALDEKGNLYVVDLGFYDVGDGMLLGSNLQLFPPGATTPSRVFVDQGNGAQGPYLAVAVDRAGNAYVTVSNAEIEVFTPGQTGTDGTPRLIPGTENASAIACDSLGNLYVYSAALTKFLVPSAGSIAVFAPGGSSPIRTISVGVGFPESVKALALSSANQLFVASGSIVVADGRPAVNQYAAGSSAPVQSFGPLTNPTAVALDALGNLYVVDLKTATVSNIVEFSPGGKLTRTLPLATSAIGIDDEP